VPRSNLRLQLDPAQDLVLQTNGEAGQRGPPANAGAAKRPELGRRQHRLQIWCVHRASIKPSLEPFRPATPPNTRRRRSRHPPPGSFTAAQVAGLRRPFRTDTESRSLEAPHRHMTRAHNVNVYQVATCVPTPTAPALAVDDYGRGPLARSRPQVELFARNNGQYLAAHHVRFYCLAPLLGQQVPCPHFVTGSTTSRAAFRPEVLTNALHRLDLRRHPTREQAIQPRNKRLPNWRGVVEAASLLGIPISGTTVGVDNGGDPVGDLLPNRPGS